MATKWHKTELILPRCNQFVEFIVQSDDTFGNQYQTRYMGWRENPKSITCPETPWFADGAGEWFAMSKVTHWRKLDRLPKIIRKRKNNN